MKRLLLSPARLVAVVVLVVLSSASTASAQISSPPPGQTFKPSAAFSLTGVTADGTYVGDYGYSFNQNRTRFQLASLQTYSFPMSAPSQPGSYTIVVNCRDMYNNPLSTSTVNITVSGP